MNTILKIVSFDYISRSIKKSAMKNHNWSTFIKRMPIKASKKLIFNSWTSQENLERWILSKAEFTSLDGGLKNRSVEISKGDTYTWMWHGSDFLAEGTILENNQNNLLGFTFLGCDVTIEIKEEDNENIIELIQSRIPLDEDSRMSHYMGCSRGWTFYLTNLKSILEGGIDLRNKNGNLTNVINT